MNLTKKNNKVTSQWLSFSFLRLLLLPLMLSVLSFGVEDQARVQAQEYQYEKHPYEFTVHLNEFRESHQKKYSNDDTTKNTDNPKLGIHLSQPQKSNEDDGASTLTASGVVAPHNYYRVRSFEYVNPSTGEMPWIYTHGGVRKGDILVQIDNIALNPSTTLRQVIQLLKKANSLTFLYPGKVHHSNFHHDTVINSADTAATSMTTTTGSNISNSSKKIATLYILRDNSVLFSMQSSIADFSGDDSDNTSACHMKAIKIADPVDGCIDNDTTNDLTSRYDAYAKYYNEEVEDENHIQAHQEEPYYLIAKRGKCTFVSKGLHAQTQENAHASIVINHDDTLFPMPIDPNRDHSIWKHVQKQQDAPVLSSSDFHHTHHHSHHKILSHLKLDIPAIMISHSSGEQIIHLVNQFQSEQLRLQQKLEDINDHNNRVDLIRRHRKQNQIYGLLDVQNKCSSSHILNNILKQKPSNQVQGQEESNNQSNSLQQHETVAKQSIQSMKRQDHHYHHQQQRDYDKKTHSQRRDDLKNQRQLHLRDYKKHNVLKTNKAKLQKKEETSFSQKKQQKSHSFQNNYDSNNNSRYRAIHRFHSQAKQFYSDNNKEEL